jgi:hypothetical protein
MGKKEYTHVALNLSSGSGINRKLDRTLGYMSTDTDLMHFNSFKDKWIMLEEKHFERWVHNIWNQQK